MRRSGIALVLVGALGGCLPTNFVAPAGTEKKPATDKSAIVNAEAPRKPTAPVTAAQINQANAHEKAQDLRGEMENDLLNHIEGQDKKD
jgi:hypothetical protein